MGQIEKATGLLCSIKITEEVIYNAVKLPRISTVPLNPAVKFTFLDKDFPFNTEGGEWVITISQVVSYCADRKG